MLTTHVSSSKLSSSSGQPAHSVSIFIFPVVPDPYNSRFCSSYISIETDLYPGSVGLVTYLLPKPMYPISDGPYVNVACWRSLAVLSARFVAGPPFCSDAREAALHLHFPDTEFLACWHNPVDLPPLQHYFRDSAFANFQRYVTITTGLNKLDLFDFNAVPSPFYQLGAYL